VIDPRDHSAIETALTDVLQGETIQPFDVRALTALRQLLWLEVTATTGKPVIYVIARDITRRKSIEKQMLRHQRLLEMAGESALIVSKALPLLFGSAVCRLGWL